MQIHSWYRLRRAVVSILKKIYTELALIRKELQDVRNNKESYSLINENTNVNYRIHTTELKFIDKGAHLMEVAFRVPYPDWCVLQDSQSWKQVEKELCLMKNKDNRNIHIAEQD